MNLLNCLASTGVTWSLEKSSRPYMPDSRHSVPTILVKIWSEPGADPITCHFRVQTELTVEEIVGRAMHEKMPDHPVFKTWFESRGHVPVRLNESIKLDDLEKGPAWHFLSEPVHVALRKLADSKVSCITWNALHQMHNDDIAAMYEAISTVLKNAFANGAGNIKRRALATKLSKAVVESLEEQRYICLENKHKTEFARTDSEKFALQMMTLGCEMTTIEEWMWAWLGYLVDDVPSEEQRAVQVA